MSGTRDHYSVLGVPPTASARQIRDAYRALARAHHPDLNPDDPEAERMFKRISRAWEVLRDPKTRRAYDERHSRGRFAGPGAGGPQSVVLEPKGPLYHMDLGHHSDFYQTGDPLTVSEAAALVGRDPSVLRRAIRERRLAASADGRRYLVRRRDVERLDRTIRRRRPRTAAEPDPSVEAAAEA